MNPSRPRRPSIRDTFPSGQRQQSSASVATHSPERTDPGPDMSAATPADTVATTAESVATSADTATAASTRRLSKFTVLLTPADVVMFDQLALDVRTRLNGRRVAKGDLVRALVALASDDATLRDQLINELDSNASR